MFSPNDSPLAGRSGQFLTSTKIGERLSKEADSSVSLKVLPGRHSSEAFEVQARGELQLGLLIGEQNHLVRYVIRGDLWYFTMTKTCVWSTVMTSTACLSYVGVF